MKADPATARYAAQWRRRHLREQNAARKAAKRVALRAKWDLANFKAARAFARTHPHGLELLRALRCGEGPCTDMRAKLRRFGRLSDAQCEFALKLYREKNGKGPRGGKLYDPLPPDLTKRVLVRGTVLVSKTKDSEFGPTWKMLVEWTHENGASKVWGGVPAEIKEAYQAVRDAAGFSDAPDKHEWLSGCSVEFMARVKASQTEKNFGFYSRPTKGSVAPKSEGV